MNVLRWYLGAAGAASLEALGFPPDTNEGETWRSAPQLRTRLVSRGYGLASSEQCHKARNRQNWLWSGKVCGLSHRTTLPQFCQATLRSI